MVYLAPADPMNEGGIENRWMDTFEGIHTA